MRLEGLGTELGFISLILWAVIAIDRWLYPVYKRWQARKNHNPGRASDTLKLTNNDKMVDVKLLQQAFQIHEKEIDKCVDEIKGELREFRKELSEHGARLLVLESHRVSRS